MAHKFNEDEKEVQEFGDFLGFGVHKVQMVLAEASQTEEGKEFIELNIQGEAGEEDKARVWFVGGATKISFKTLRQIIVHNAKTEEAKEKARKAVDAVKDTDALVDILNTNCMGGELWFTKYQDPTRTYVGKDGKTRQSVNKNVYGYEPKLNEALMPANQKQIEPKDFPEDDVPFGDDPKPAASTIPDNWS